MSDAKHTPGPWVAIHEPGHSSDTLTDNGGYRIDAPSDDVTQLAFVWVLNHRVPADGGPQSTGPHFGDIRAGANARLIAAAPDLLAALQRLSAGMNDAWNSNPAVLADEVKQARIAIAKATQQTTDERTPRNEQAHEPD